MKINKFLLLKIVLLGAIIVGVSVFYNTNNKEDQIVQSENLVPQKQYTDNEHGFSFTYPDSIQVFDWDHSSFTEYENLSQAILISVQDRELEAGGPCGENSPETFDFEKKYLESNFVERKLMEQDQEPSARGSFVVSGIHKVGITNSGENFLLTIETCQGIADEDDSGNVAIRAHIYKDNIRIGISLRDMEGFNPEVKVRDIEKVAQQLMDGTYEGEMQNRLNQFMEIVSTLKWN